MTIYCAFVMSVFISTYCYFTISVKLCLLLSEQYNVLVINHLCFTDLVRTLHLLTLFVSFVSIGVLHID